MFGSLRDKLKNFVKRTEEAGGVEAAEAEPAPAQEAQPQPPEEGEPEPQPTLEAEAQPPQEPAAAQEQQAQPKLSAQTRVRGLLSRKVTLSEGDLDNLLHDLELDLLQSDVAMETCEKTLAKLKGKLASEEIASGKVGEFVKEKLKETLLETLTPEKEVNLLEEIKAADTPYVILFLGVNGTGKTTSMAKLAKHLMDNSLSVVFAAGDTFRAGAIEQLTKHGEALGVKTITHQKGADSAAVLFDAVEHARARKVDVVLSDSAGRMQTNNNLMDELAKIVRVNKPNLKVFVGDALTGNDAVEQARKFNEIAGVDAVILTKLDADPKGGCAISIVSEIGKPIIYVGMGQKYEDLKTFDKEWFVSQLVS